MVMSIQSMLVLQIFLKEIFARLRKLNTKSVTNTYWLEGEEVSAFVLLTREMIVPIRQKYIINNGVDFEK